MATKVVMEALSPTMEEGRLVEWKKQEGDQVAAGDVIAEVETDKAVMELVARSAGTLLKQVVAAGTTLPVSSLVAIIGEPGEDVSGLLGGTGGTVGTAGTAGTPGTAGTLGAAGRGGQRVATGNGQPAAAGASVPAVPSVPTAPSVPSSVKASPLARKMAIDRGIDLRGIAGSGPEGRIVKRDLEARITGADAGAAVRSAPPAAEAIPPFLRTAVPSGAAFTDVPLTQIRKTIARRLAQSIGPVPTFYLTTEVAMDRAWAERAALLSGQDDAAKFSFNDLVIKAVAMALRQHPACNAWWQDESIRYWSDVHVAMAVAIEDGLITPVVRHADRKTLREIAAETRDLAARARTRRLAPEEYTGGTFSVSNLGMLDIEEFTAVINPPEAGIIAVGRIAEKPVVVDGAVAVGRRMRLTMSCDHRVIDGATGAEFLKTVKQMLESPLALVW